MTRNGNSFDDRVDIGNFGVSLTLFGHVNINVYLYLERFIDVVVSCSAAYMKSIQMKGRELRLFLQKVPYQPADSDRGSKTSMRCNLLTQIPRTYCQAQEKWR